MAWVEIANRSNVGLRWCFVICYVAVVVGEHRDWGVSSSIGDLVDFIIACQAARESEEKEMLDSISCEGNNESTTEALFGTMDTTLCLLRMGFTENEVSTAIAKFGSDAPLNELANSILTSRLAFPVKEEDVTEDEVRFTCQEQNELEQLGRRVKEFPVDFTPPKDPPPPPPPPPPSFRYDDDEDNKKSVKKAKFVHPEDKATASSFSGYYPASVKKEESDDVPRSIAANHVKNESGSPFFFYGNVADVSQETWRKLSRFLFGTRPEFANSQFFSAFIRKEGYLHDLPTEVRFHVLPKPPVTIEGVLPHTMKWWPSWDTRKQLSCINSETEGLSQICDRLGRMMAASHGLPSKEQQMDILHHCRALNLVWTGRNELRPVEPDLLECILGYPKDHTGGSGFDLGGRLAALKCSFQTDTIGYLLSTLKGVFPGGLRLLSLCSGIGGAEVALHRLGIRLRCVVSVESSENNRHAMRRWWSRAGQTGELRQIAGLEKLTVRQLESLWKEFGGFDLIVGGNPGTLSSACSSAMDLNHFYEFARVLRCVRNLMGRNTASVGR
ncbi:hypothetical protein HPP92_021935 [Vanilla planifolia]|uniref:SAM-dependent MTase DRM-type domain-containing protein n=1 Tax=Vanilla planifolia TaxID=51239 RepID=A0A835PZ42_VANPL|nr:hypothetical protein HPP92_021935 [Vanilla planifolia]